MVCHKVDSYHSGTPVSAVEISLPFANHSEDLGWDLQLVRKVLVFGFLLFLCWYFIKFFTYYTHNDTIAPSVQSKF